MFDIFRFLLPIYDSCILISEPFAQLISFLSVGPFSKDLIPTVIFFVKAAHLCHPHMLSRRNLPTLVCQIHHNKKARFFQSHHLIYQLLRVILPIQGLPTSVLFWFCSFLGRCRKGTAMCSVLALLKRGEVEINFQVGIIT